jgi:hypothetical protein
MREELERFVASLAIPADRKAVVLAELVDHVESAREAARRDGRDPDAAAREALGDLEALRRSYEAIEPAFRVTRRHAIARGVIAGVAVALLIAQGGAIMHGALGAVAALAIAAVLAPPRVLELLRAELRAPRVRGALGRGVPIGAAVSYLVTILAAPMIVWIGMIVVRAARGDTDVDTPPSAFAIMAAVYLVLLVEGLRARRAVA